MPTGCCNGKGVSGASEEVKQEQPLESGSTCNEALFNQRGSQMMNSEQCTSERV
jgi:hypothetical protein